MAMPILHGPAYSTYVRTARLALEEKGVEYNLDHFDFMEGFPDEQIARHPFGRVPAFTHGEFELYETVAICRYVDEAFDGPALQPGDAAGRARVTQICSLLDCYAYGPAIGKIVTERLVSPMLNREVDESAITAAVPAAEKAYSVLEGFLGDRPYLADDTLSLADLHLAPNYAYFLMTPEGEKITQSTPNLRRWWDGIKERNAMVRTRPEFAAAG
jgi:glutathione S-transferase